MMYKSKVTFGGRLEAALTDIGMDQKELARRLCVSQSLVCCWKTGEREPKLKQLMEISRITGKGIDWLCGNEGKA